MSDVGSFYFNYIQSLSLPYMGNGVHFFLLTDIAYLSEYEFQGIG